MDKLVSIITPCYNGEKYLDRYFQSLLSQTYPSIEVIFINDGSTDTTESIALEYGKKLEEKGYRFIYISQANAGQSAAINQGLKVFSGEYLNWMDSDDYLPADSVENRVRFLKHNPTIGLVIGTTVLVDDVDYNQIALQDASKSNRLLSKDIIEDYLKGVFVNPCCSSMVRTSMFKDAMNQVMHIEDPREIGQNFQLFLPVMMNYPVRYIPEITSYCVVHNDSHSHSKKTFEQKIHILDVTYKTLYSIANRIKAEEQDREWFRAKILEYDGKNRLSVLQQYRKKDGLAKIVHHLKSMGCYDSTARKMVLKIKIPFFKKVADSIWKWRNR